MIPETFGPKLSGRVRNSAYGYCINEETKALKTILYDDAKPMDDP